MRMAGTVLGDARGFARGSRGRGSGRTTSLLEHFRVSTLAARLPQSAWWRRVLARTADESALDRESSCGQQQNEQKQQLSPRSL